MKHGAVRKLMRAAILSFLALGMASGVASAAVWAVSPAMAQADDQGGAAAGDGSGGSSNQPPAKQGEPSGGLPLVGGIVGGV